jgi:hypothetical protein
LATRPNLTDVTSGISVTNLNIPVDSTIGFTYLVPGDVLAIGGRRMARMRSSPGPMTS